MKKLILSWFLFIFFLNIYSNAQNYHADHQVFGINKEATHPLLFPYNNEEAAIRNEAKNSPWFQDLNGYWKFNWVRNPQNKPIDFHIPNFDDSDWEQIPVPGTGKSMVMDIPSI